MTTSKFKKLLSRKYLSETWSEFYRRHKRQTSSGVDNVTVSQFEANKDRYLNDIFHKLHSPSGYVFSPLYAVPIEKPDSNKKRIICIPTVGDRLVQRCIEKRLSSDAANCGIKNEASYGFIAGDDRGVVAARNRAVLLRNQYPWAYKSDISAFFDNIPRDQLIDQTVGILRAKSFREIIARIVSSEIDERSSDIRRIVRENGIVRGRGVRQGMPLAPLFSNVILRNFDATLIKNGINLVRYADDFIVLANSREDCLKIDSTVRKLLAPLGLELPAIGEQSKTQIKAPDEEIAFLGLSLERNNKNGKYGLVIGQRQLEKIRRNINSLKDVQQLVRDGINIASFGQRLERQIAGYKMAYSNAQNAPELNSILETARSDLLRHIFVKAFTEAQVQKLNDDMKKFFCLID